MVNLLFRPARIDGGESVRIALHLLKEKLPDLQVEFQSLRLHPVGLAGNPRQAFLGGQIEDYR